MALKTFSPFTWQNCWKYGIMKKGIPVQPFAKTLEKSKGHSI
jgi:hypothetical protein